MSQIIKTTKMMLLIIQIQKNRPNIRTFSYQQICKSDYNQMAIKANGFPQGKERLL